MIDKSKTHVVYYGYDLEFRGLYLDTLDKIDLKSDPPEQFLPGHKYLVIWNDEANNDDEQPFKIIQDKYGIHYGPRSENHWDYTKAPYLTTRDGIIFKFIYKRYERAMQWLSEDEYENLSNLIDTIKLKLRNAELESGVSKRSGNRWYRLTFEKLKDFSGDIIDFCENTDYIKTAPEIGFTKKCRTIDEIKSAFDYFLSKPDDSIMGLDYETHGGMPMDDDTFEVVGLGIACCDEEAAAAYFDLQWMIDYGTEGEYDYFIKRYNEYLDKFENSVTYNNSFEQRVTYLLTKRLILFDEGATANKCDGRVYKRFSLKYTAQICLGVRSWDDDYDILVGDLLPDLFGWDEDTEEYKWTMTEEYDSDGNLKMNTWFEGEGDESHEVSVSTYYRNNPTWKKICDRYPDQVDEFIKLIENPKYYGDPFGCVPSDLQTYYCCRDSFYTGHLKKYTLSKYTQLCYDTYNNNLRLEALLHLTGFFCNEDLRVRMELQCLWLEVYGKLNVTKWALSVRLGWFKNLQVPDIPEITKLLRLGYDPCDSKSIIMNYLSDTSESGLDEEALLPILGQEVLDIYKHYIHEYCYRIDESYKRSRKIFNELNAELEDRYKPDFGENNEYCCWTVGGKQYKIDLCYDILCDYYSTESNFKLISYLEKQLNFTEIEKLLLPQLNETPNLPLKLIAPKDIDHITTIVSEGNFLGYIEPSHPEYTKLMDEYSLDDVLDLCDSCFNLKSAKESPYFKFMTYKKYKGLILNAFPDYDSVPREYVMPVTEENIKKCDESGFEPPWCESQAKLIINEDLDRLKTTKAWKYFELNHDYISLLYAGIIDEEVWDEKLGRNTPLFCLTDTGEKDDDGNPVMGWSPEVDEWFDVVKTQLTGGWFDFMPRYMGYWSMSDEDKDWFNKHIDEVDVTEDSVQALAKLNHCFMSYRKYEKVCGTYLRGVHFQEYNYDCQGFDENGITPNRYEEKGVHKCYIPFYANAKKSKRWSSGYHTIPSKSEMKRLVDTPPGFLLSYFDISGAEIRTISFMAQDEFMMDCYHKDLDPYITMAKFTFPREQYSDMDDDEYMDFLKSWRGTFKQVLLGSLYGMGVDKMADLAEIDVDTAQKVMDDLWERCPGLKKFIEEKSQWAMDHPGYVQSALGDVLEMDDDDGEDRLARLGINQFIQNYSSVSLADGFFNNIEKSIHHRDEVLNAPDFMLRPAGVVHDSCQIMFPTKYLFEMSEYYTRNLSGYLYDIHKILYAFDLEMGINYYDICDVKQLDPTHLQVSGNYISVNGLIQKCRLDGLKFRVTKLQLTKKHEDPIDIDVNGFEFGELFAPKLPKSFIKQFWDNNCYAKFNEDKSKFKCILEKITDEPEQSTSTWTPPF